SCNGRQEPSTTLDTGGHAIDSSPRSSARAVLCSGVNIVVASLKGGVGKSTAAVYLAAAAAQRGHNPVLLVDADRQASSAVWLEERPVDGVEVIEAPSERTLKRAMANNGGMTIVDT